MPEVVTAPPLIMVASPVPMLTLVRAVTPPTAPVNVVVPEPLAMLRVLAPLTVPPKVTPPALVEVKVVSAPSVTLSL